MTRAPLIGLLVVIAMAWLGSSSFTKKYTNDDGQRTDYTFQPLARYQGKTEARIGRDHSDVPLEKMVGQMLVVGFNGTSRKQPHPKAVAQQLADGQIGGVMFLGRNIRSRKQVEALTKFFHAAGAPFPAIVAVDQEGGKVQRLSRRKGYSRYPSAKDIAALHTAAEAQELYSALAKEIRESGFNLNFGPVVDLDLYASNPIIGRKDRSFGSDATLVTAFAKAFIVAHREAGVLTSAKHFPGHGSSRTDSHRTLVDLSQSWKPRELVPYRKLVKEGLMDSVMVGHLYHPRFSLGDKVPATLSTRAVNDLLRKDVGFDGVVITDDLEMGAISRNHSFEDSVVKAINAGNDILLFSNRRAGGVSLPDKIMAIVRDALRDGRIKTATIRRAFHRVIALKRKLSRLPSTVGELNDRLPSKSVAQRTLDH